MAAELQASSLRRCCICRFDVEVEKERRRCNSNVIV